MVAPDRLVLYIPAHGRPAWPVRALEMVCENVAKGHRSTDVCRGEDALNLVRGSPDFRFLITDLEMPDDSFARAQ